MMQTERVRQTHGEATTDWREHLEHLLAEPLEQVRERAATAYDRAVGEPARPIVILGAGNLGRKLLAGLREEGVQPLAFSDNSASLWGREIDGLPVLSPADAARLHGESATFVLAIWRGEALESMADRVASYQRIGCRQVVHFGLLFWKYPQRFLPHFSLDLPQHVLTESEQIRAAFALLADDASRSAFVRHVHWRLHLDFDYLPHPASGAIYLREELFSLAADEVFVDCGAYDGDTLQQFVQYSDGQFAHAYCLEADPLNAERLRERAAALPAELAGRVSVLPVAVGEQSGTLRMHATGSVSSVVCADGDVEVACVTLDEALAGKKVTLLKMDIEGHEPAALRGAAACIREQRPVMAICVYHLQDHLWTLPLLMQSLATDYRFYLRAHVHDGWDLVCYAVPVERALEVC